MSEQLENTHLDAIQPLVTPRQVKTNLPLTDKVADLVARTRHEIQDILHGRDNRRLLVVIGPCSIHDSKAAFEYAERLKSVIDKTHDRLIIVMRTYFEKPRTTVGWKGLINDPHLDGSYDIAAGLGIAREILLHINELGVPCACEVLDPVTPQYVADLMSWAAIGARTTESQTHREMASGLSMPIGFKNGTDGKVQSAINAMISASHPHCFLGINADGMTSIVRTNGNPDRHIVLRGGGGKPNCGPEDIAQAVEMVAGEEIPRAVMVDCSHDNSGKDHTKQGQVCRDTLSVFGQGQKEIMGLLIESNLNPGKQAWKQGVKLQYGVSITDACIGWEETEALLYELAEEIPV